MTNYENDDDENYRSMTFWLFQKSRLKIDDNYKGKRQCFLIYDFKRGERRNVGVFTYFSTDWDGTQAPRYDYEKIYFYTNKREIKEVLKQLKKDKIYYRKNKDIAFAKDRKLYYYKVRQESLKADFV